MKKCLEIIISVFVLVVGLSLPVAAQDATYSCGAYGAGNYSTNDCATDGGGNDSPDETDMSNSNRSGSRSSGSQNVNDEAGNNAASETTTDPKPESGLFVIIFAKLAASWGWVTVFLLLVIAGVVLIGATRRKKNRD